MHAERAARTTVGFWQSVCTQREQLELPMVPGKLLARRASSSISDDFRQVVGMQREQLELCWVLASCWHAERLSSCWLAERASRITDVFGSAVCMQSEQLELLLGSGKLFARSARTTNVFWQAVCTQCAQLELRLSSSKCLHTKRAARTTDDFGKMFAGKASSSHHC